MWSRDSELGEQISTVFFMRAIPSTLVSKPAKLLKNLWIMQLTFNFQQSSERVARPNCPTVILCHPNCDKRSWPWFLPSSLTLTQHPIAPTISIMELCSDYVQDIWCIENSVVRKRKDQKITNCSRIISLITLFLL